MYFLSLLSEYLRNFEAMLYLNWKGVWDFTSTILLFYYSKRRRTTGPTASKDIAYRDPSTSLSSSPFLAAMNLDQDCYSIFNLGTSHYRIWLISFLVSMSPELY